MRWPFACCGLGNSGLFSFPHYRCVSLHSHQRSVGSCSELPTWSPVPGQALPLETWEWHPNLALLGSLFTGTWIFSKRLRLV